MKLFGAGKAILAHKQYCIEKNRLSESQLKSLNEFLNFTFIKRYLSNNESAKRSRKYEKVIVET